MSGNSCTQGSGSEPEPTPGKPDKFDKPATVQPLSPARYQVAFTASEELRDKLERLQALIPGGDLASIIDAAVSEKLERLEAKRYGKTTKPRKKLEDASCPAHNAYMAELDYGKEKMDRHRRSAERVGEPQATLELGRDNVA